MDMNEYIDKCHQYLMKTPERLADYQQSKLITSDTVRRYRIGYDLAEGRYTIPITSIVGDVINIRKYKINPEPGIPKYINIKGSHNYLFPVANALNCTELYITEGEHDALTLIQAGLPAITQTAGAAGWDDAWNELFTDKTIVIVYDNDQPGREGAVKLREKLAGYANEIHDIILPVKDVNDYFKAGNGKDDFISLVEAYREYKDTSITKAMDAALYDKRIQFEGIVVGKDLSPYLVPKEVIASCGANMDQRKCRSCSFSVLGRRTIIKKFLYDTHKSDILRFINSSNRVVEDSIRTAFSIVPKQVCRAPVIEIKSRQNVEMVELIPQIDYSSDANEYSLRTGFYFGKDISTNQAYVCQGTCYTHPKTQQGTFLIKKATGVTDSISRFELTPEIKEKLKIFQPDNSDVVSILKKIESIYNDLSYNVTKIYGRDDLIVATLLTYHSVLSFSFLGLPLRKSWLECCIVGDTETGKTDTIQHLVQHFRAGEFITSAENTTLAGLLGALQQTSSGRWTVTWSKIPLNDKGLIVLDEADRICESGIVSQLSGVRSSGVAELVKVQAQRTTARTRILWIANPLWGRMTEHNFGIETVKELFKNQQDIRRIDFVVGCSKEQIRDEEINKVREKTFDHVFTSELCHLSIMRAWNVKPENVKFCDDAVEKILKLSIEWGQKYSADIPIMLGSGVKNKLARLSVALATMLYSTTTGDDVIVTEAHVAYIRLYLESLYDLKPLSFHEYSLQKNRFKQLYDKEELDLIIRTVAVVDELLENNGLTSHDVEDIFDVDRDGARSIICKLRRFGAIKKVYQYYKKSKSFIEYLQARKRELRS